MSLRHSYALLTPIYDLIVSATSAPLRQHSLLRLNTETEQRILLPGIGTGLDIPFLPEGPQYSGFDLTPNMLAKAKKRAEQSSSNIDLTEGDVHQMPYPDASFDAVVMHLILAVVPRPDLALSEASRVLKPGGHLYILDKFLKPNETALLKRAINPFIRHIATRTDVVFEELLAQRPELKLIDDQPTHLTSWFRYITLNKQ